VDEASRRALDHAAATAIAYRTKTSDAGHTPVADDRTIHDVLAAPLPEAGADIDAVPAELIEGATPGIRAQTGPRFFFWVIGDLHPAGVAADWLTSAWGQNMANLSAARAALRPERWSRPWGAQGLPSWSSAMPLPSSARHNGRGNR
jgi:glutamate/tyrosine decarboxylase-like PLP-dependent enzyme